MDVFFLLHDDACNAIAVAMGSKYYGSTYTNENASIKIGEVGGSCCFF